MFFKRRFETIESDIRDIYLRSEINEDMIDDNFARAGATIEGILTLMGKVLVNTMEPQKGDHDLENGWVIRSAKKQAESARKLNKALAKAIRKTMKKPHKTLPKKVVKKAKK